MNAQLLLFLSGDTSLFLILIATGLLAFCSILCTVFLYQINKTTKDLRDIEIAKARESTLNKTILIGPKTVKELSNKKIK